MGTIIAVVGLGALLSFAQSVRLGFSGPISSVAGVLLVPAFISLLWYLSVELRWWNVVVFLVTSLVVGALNAVFMRSRGRLALVSMQPLTSAVFCIAAVACWFVPT